MVEKVEAQARDVAPQERRIECLEVLLSRFGIDSVLIGVPKLARALGMGASTIYAYMRAGKFFMTYRMVNGTPMVKIDDLIDWYLSAESDVRPLPSEPVEKSKMDEGSSEIANPVEPPSEGASARRGRKRGSEKAVDARRVEFRPIDVANKEDADDAVDGLVASVMARMDRQRRCAPPANS